MKESSEVLSRGSSPEKRSILRDKSAWTLIISNVAVIIIAIHEKWLLPQLMIVYWAQSIIIGFFNFVRILFLKDSRVPQEPALEKLGIPNSKMKIIMACFFALHYGFTHMIYLVFIHIFSFQKSVKAELNYAGIFICVLIFLVNHFFSFLYNLKRDSAGSSDIQEMISEPYLRILPMHLTIIFGFLLVKSVIGTVIFLTLKSLVDLKMHRKKHSIDDVESEAKVEIIEETPKKPGKPTKPGGVKFAGGSLKRPNGKN